MNLPIGQPLGMPSGGSAPTINTRKVVRSSSIKRKGKSIPITDKVQLEKVLGLTVSSNATLSVCEPSGTIAYPAGCVIVLLNARKNKQSHIFNSSKKTITSLALSPDGRHLVSGESGHQPAVRIWDLEGPYTQTAEFHGHKFGINCVAFSTNMKYVVSIGTEHDMIVNVWNWRSQTKVSSNKVAAKVTDIAFSEDSSYFVTVGNRHVKFWYLDTSRSKVKETVPLMGRSGILGEQKNNYFCGVACGLGRCMRSTYVVAQAGLLCEFNDKRLLSKWVELRTTGANCIAVGKEHIFIGCSNGIVRIFDPYTLNFLATMPRPHSLGIDVAAGLHPSHLANQHHDNAKFPDCNALVLDIHNHKVTCVYNDHSLYMWDVKDVRKVGKVYSSLSHSGCIWGLETYPKIDTGSGCLSKGTFVTSSSDDTIRIWNTDPHMRSDMPLKRNIYSHDLLKMVYADPELNCLCDVEFNPAGSTDKTDNTYSGKNGVRCVKFSLDGQQLASGDRSGNIRVYALPSMNELCLLEAHDAEVLGLEFSPPETGYRFLASASRDRLIHVFDADQDFSLLQTLDDHSSAITAVHFTEHDGQLQMLSCGADKSLLFRTASEAPDVQFYLNRHLVGKTTLYDMDIDPTKKFVATACQDRNVRIYNMKNGKQKKCYKGSVAEDGTLIKIQLDPSGTYAVTSCSDKNLCIMDFFSGEIVATMFGHSEIVTGVRFLDDMRHVVSVSGDGCIFVWRLSPEFTHQMHKRYAELHQNKLNSASSTSLRRETYNTIPASLLPDVINNNPEDVTDLSHAGDQQSYQEVFVSPSKVFSDADEKAADHSMDVPPKLDYRFSVGQLPSWAKKQVSQDPFNPSKITSTMNNTVAPRGRWAQRVDNQGLVVKSMLDENSAIQMSLADCMEINLEDKRRLTVEPDSLAFSQLSEIRRETMVMSKSVSVITDDDENNRDDDDEEDEFHPATLELIDRLEHSAAAKHRSTGLVTMSRGSDQFSSSDDQTSDLKVSDEFTDEDEEEELDEKNIFYLPHDDESESRDTHLNTFQVFASSDRRKSGGSDSLNKDADTLDGDVLASPRESEGTEPTSLDDINSDEEFGVEDSPSYPVTPSTPIDVERAFEAHLPEREKFLKQTFENLATSPTRKETFDNQIPFTTPQHPTGARLSISARFLSNSQTTKLRNSNFYSNLSQNRNPSYSNANMNLKRKDEMAKAVDETRKKLDALGWKSLDSGTDSVPVRDLNGRHLSFVSSTSSSYHYTRSTSHKMDGHLDRRPSGPDISKLGRSTRKSQGGTPVRKWRSMFDVSGQPQGRKSMPLRSPSPQRFRSSSPPTTPTMRTPQTFKSTSPSRYVVKTEVRLESPTHQMRLRSHSNTATSSSTASLTRGRSTPSEDTTTRRSTPGRPSYMCGTESSMAKTLPTVTFNKDEPAPKLKPANSVSVLSPPRRNLKKGRYSLGSNLESSSQFKSTPNLATHPEDSESDTDMSVKSDTGDTPTGNHNGDLMQSPVLTPKKWGGSASNISSIRRSLSKESVDDNIMSSVKQPPKAPEKGEGTGDKASVTAIHKPTARRILGDSDSVTDTDPDKKAMPPPAVVRVARTKTSFLKKAARRSMPELTLSQAKEILRGKIDVLDKENTLPEKSSSSSSPSLVSSSSSIINTFVPTLDVTVMTPSDKLNDSPVKSTSLKDLDASPMELPVKEYSPMKDSQDTSRKNSSLPVRDSGIGSSITVSPISTMAVSEVVTSIAMATTVTMTTSIAKTSNSVIDAKRSLNNRDATNNNDLHKKGSTGSDTLITTRTNGLKTRGGRKLPTPMLRNKSHSKDSDSSELSQGSGTSSGSLANHRVTSSLNKRRSDADKSAEDQIPLTSPRSPTKKSPHNSSASDADRTNRSLHSKKEMAKTAEEVRSDILDKHNKKLSSLSSSTSEIPSKETVSSRSAERPSYKFTLKKTPPSSSSNSQSSSNRPPSPSKIASKYSPPTSSLSSASSSTSSSISPPQQQTNRTTDRSGTLTTQKPDVSPHRHAGHVSSTAPQKAEPDSGRQTSRPPPHSRPLTRHTDSPALTNGSVSPQNSVSSPDRSRLSLPLTKTASPLTNTGIEACHTAVDDMKRTAQHAIKLYKQIHLSLTDGSPQLTPQHDTSPQLKLLNDTFRDLAAMFSELQTAAKPETKEQGTNTAHEEVELDERVLTVMTPLLSQYSNKLSDQVLGLVKKKLDIRE